MKKEDIHLDWENENIHIVKEYFKAKSVEGLSNKTLVAYKRSYNYFFSYMRKHYSLITTDDIREFLDWYQGLNDCSHITLDNLRKHLSSLFAWLHKNDYIFKNPMTRIKKIRGQTKVKKAFTDYELEKLRDSIPSDDIRLKAVFELLLSSGIRIGELVGLNRNDMNFNNLTFKVLGKGNKERTCYFNNKAKLYLQQYLMSRDDDNPALFVTSHTPNDRVGKSGHERIMRELGEKCGVKCHPHKFRRTMATNAIRRGMPIEQVQKLLGHESISTTMIYVNVDQDAVKLNHTKYTN
ncbi:MAG: tyrosine-type recombinase/integrase [Methanobrevibacter sp.]|nr:tyrosine-type recombinase/integrase [Methanosphaera sp.]MBR0371090.1 tyrosine-type recombinase/integrase [Methanobrevibacter sp.]